MVVGWTSAGGGDAGGGGDGGGGGGGVGGRRPLEGTSSLASLVVTSRETAHT